MRARKTHAANREDYDGFDAPPPEVFDLPPEAPIDEAPMELAMSSGPALSAPVHACLVCGDDPSIDSGCPHFEVVTVATLSPAMLHCLAESRAQHEALREQLRTLRRLAGAAVIAGDAAIEVHEAPVVAPRVVLIPPPAAKRPRKAPRPVVEQGRFGFVECVNDGAGEPAGKASGPADAGERGGDVVGDHVPVTGHGEGQVGGR